MSTMEKLPYLSADELQFHFVRASGPGGQNVNKVATAVELRFDVRASRSLPEEIKSRLLMQCAGRINKHGILIIEASRFRTQERNRQDAIERLAELLRAASVRPKKRIKTRVPAGAKRERIQAKARRGRTKQLRGKPAFDE